MNGFCLICGEALILKICQSQAGYYVGTWCHCGPNSRESKYFGDAEMARRELEARPRALAWQPKPGIVGEGALP